MQSMPEGFEWHEQPDTAKVSVRRIQPTSILPGERELVCELLRRHFPADAFLVATHGNSLTIYLSEANPDRTIRELRAGLTTSAARYQELTRWLYRRANFSPIYRFVLVDEE